MFYHQRFRSQCYFKSLKGFVCFKPEFDNLGSYNTTSCIAHKIHLSEPGRPLREHFERFQQRLEPRFWFTNVSQPFGIYWVRKSHTSPAAICTTLSCAYWCACSLRLIWIASVKPPQVWRSRPVLCLPLPSITVYYIHVADAFIPSKYNECIQARGRKNHASPSIVAVVAVLSGVWATAVWRLTSGRAHYTPPWTGRVTEEPDRALCHPGSYQFTKTIQHT